MKCINALLIDHANLSQALVITHQHQTQEKHLLRIIETELKIYRLQHGLQGLGIIADNFPDLLDVILPMLGFEGDFSNELLDFYYHQLNRYMAIPLPEFQAHLSELAWQFLHALKEYSIGN